jgi:hypothetical protein
VAGGGGHGGASQGGNGRQDAGPGRKLRDLLWLGGGSGGRKGGVRADIRKILGRRRWCGGV